MKSEAAHRIEQTAKKYFIGEDEYHLEEKETGFVLLGEQTDNDKLEPVRTTYTLIADTLTILKETRSPFQFRHQYTFTRAAKIAPEKTLLPAQMSEDFAIFKRAITQFYPGLYRYNTPLEIESGFAALEAKLQNPLPEGEFFKLLAQFASLIRCGHTYLNPLNQTDAVQARLFERRIYLPFYFRLLNRRMIVTGNVSSKKLATGSEITKINGVPVDSVKKAGGDLYEILTDATCEPIKPAPEHFTGKTYFISDAANASAAYQFVRAVKVNKLATIFGEETGGNLQGINGDNYFLLRLPNSTFETDIPVYFQAPLAPQKDSGVMPDYRIEPNADDIAAGRDTELNYIFKAIKAEPNVKNNR